VKSDVPECSKGAQAGKLAEASDKRAKNRDPEWKVDCARKNVVSGKITIRRGGPACSLSGKAREPNRGRDWRCEKKGRSLQREEGNCKRKSLEECMIDQ